MRWLIQSSRSIQVLTHDTTQSIYFGCQSAFKWYLYSQILISRIQLFNSRASLRATWNGVTDFDVNQLVSPTGAPVLYRLRTIYRSTLIFNSQDHRLGRPFTLSQPTEPVRVGVTVEQHAQVEVDPFAARVKSRSKRAKVCSAITGTNSIESVIKAHDEHEMTDFPLAMRALNADAAEMDEDKKIAAVA